MTPAYADTIYWSHTFEEIRAAVRVKLGFESAKLATAAQGIALIAERVFGGGDGTPKGSRSVPEGVMVPRNSKELEMALSAVLRR